MAKSNACDSVEYGMRGGEIIIEGNAGAGVGNNTIGGEIWVKCGIHSLGAIRSEKVYEGEEKCEIASKNL